MKPKAGRGRSFEDVLKMVALEGTTALVWVLVLVILDVLAGMGTGTGGGIDRAGAEGTAGLAGLAAGLAFATVLMGA